MDTKPKIYAFCEPSGRGTDVIGFAVTAEGVLLGNHVSSDSTYSKCDLGVTSDLMHHRYDKYFPEGWEIEWVDDPKNHFILKQFLRTA